MIVTIQSLEPCFQLVPSDDCANCDVIEVYNASPAFALEAMSELCDAFIEMYLNDFMKGDPGLTPYIGLNGNWFIGDADTGVHAKGEDGNDGVGIVSFTLESTVGKTKTYRMLFTDASYTDIAIVDGADGDKGDKGDTGTGAYEIYVVGGGTLSEEDFNTAITLIPEHISDEDIHHSTEDLNAAYEPKNSNIQEHISDETIHHTIEELNGVYEPKNANIQSHISDATKHIDTNTEFSGAIDETNDKFTIWDNSLLKWIKFSFTSMKTWLNSLYLKLDQTTPQTILGLLQNQSTAAMESAPLSDELLTSSNWSSTDWTGDFVNGFTHTTGNVTPLTNTLAALNATLYQISFVVTNRTAGSFTVSFGSQTSQAYSSTNAWGVKTTGVGTLSITPTSDFNGTIVISIKRITGTYAPTYQILDSTGAINIEIRSSLNTLNNTFIGKGAGRYNTTGSNNSAQGVSALQNNTTGSNNSAQGVNALYYNTTGSYNSAQGYAALFYNTTGYFNSAQGVNALYYNTTGSNNSAQGVNALYYNTTGSNNSAQGVNALYYNTTGSYNSAQGYAALFYNTTGYFNSAQGVNALYYNTTGSNNSAQGVNALYYNTTGYQNSAQGVNALYYNTTGYANSAQGFYSLQSNTTGSFNSAQGAYALYFNTTGNNNSAQGASAGRYLADGVTVNQTSNNSVFLGANTKSKQAGQTNEIVIGANAVGNGSNSVTLGHTNITDTYLRGLVHLNNGIQIGDNTAAASEALKGVVRYRENAGGSFYEMCMKGTDGVYRWTSIVTIQ